jgi:hypothetical protein
MHQTRQQQSNRTKDQSKDWRKLVDYLHLTTC